MAPATVNLMSMSIATPINKYLKKSLARKTLYLFNFRLPVKSSAVVATAATRQALSSCDNNFYNSIWLFSLARHIFWMKFPVALSSFLYLYDKKRGA